jgi:hypothetical protein
MAKVDAHSLLSGMSPWGTLDDLDLINQDAEDFEDKVPLWHGVPD